MCIVIYTYNNQLLMATNIWSYFNVQSFTKCTFPPHDLTSKSNAFSMHQLNIISKLVTSIYICNFIPSFKPHIRTIKTVKLQRSDDIQFSYLHFYPNYHENIFQIKCLNYMIQFFHSIFCFFLFNYFFNITNFGKFFFNQRDNFSALDE